MSTWTALEFTGLRQYRLPPGCRGCRWHQRVDGGCQSSGTNLGWGPGRSTVQAPEKSKGKDQEMVQTFTVNMLFDDLFGIFGGISDLFRHTQTLVRNWVFSFFDFDTLCGWWSQLNILVEVEATNPVESVDCNVRCNPIRKPYLFWRPCWTSYL